MVTSSAVVGSSAMSSWGRMQRHGDHHPLAHPARELVRVGVAPVAWVGDPDLGQQLQRPGAGLVCVDAVVRSSPRRPGRRRASAG